jgi:preprotein translocase subunit SecG
LRYFLLVFHLLLTLIMIGVILMQRGEDASAGSGSGGGMPGARSGKNFLTRLTAILAAIFFANCVVMAILVRKESKLNPVVTLAPSEKKEALPAVSGPSGALPVGGLPAGGLPVDKASASQPSGAGTGLKQNPSAVGLKPVRNAAKTALQPLQNAAKTVVLNKKQGAQQGPIEPNRAQQGKNGKDGKK